MGQSMTEYTIVLVFGVLALTTGPSGDVMLQLLNVMKANYQGYSFAISMSEPPDYDNVTDYRNALIIAGLSNDEIDKLAVESADLYTDLSRYNIDPLRKIKDTVTRISNCVSQIPTSISQLQNNKIQC